eukprot:CAMPEP_0196663740 /NCGR_PEP_ID=MMETSP1086-20130531/54048_1 /TAXON_ID=77921 /ORGANISM="Cyanoptyche  gloeocystis , Strain SAG4.97" /LENGTH=334 /DNA_ID=CAMNT_0041999677 /DNA_START=365 /DNA_END=1369 /DNA_ORIENTATION=-
MTIASVPQEDFEEPIRVAITGAAGNVGYAALMKIANGEMLGLKQPVILQCLEIPQALKALEGVALELEDCDFPLLRKVKLFDDPYKAFEGVKYALLIGSRPRGPGMERKDLLAVNGKIFVEQARALNAVADRSVKVGVIGNPANTNCLIAAHNAPDIPPENFTAMTRLDHNRAVAQVSKKTKIHTSELEHICVWGNHSATLYPDVFHATARGQPVMDFIGDIDWVKNVFIPKVQNRGAEIIAKRGLSSAASAANAAVEHMRDWALGSNEWVSMAVPSDGCYGIPEGVYYSFPTICKDGRFEIVKGLELDEFSEEKIRVSCADLFHERDMVQEFL